MVYLLPGRVLKAISLADCYSLIYQYPLTGDVMAYFVTIRLYMYYLCDVYTDPYLIIVNN